MNEIETLVQNLWQALQSMGLLKGLLFALFFLVVWFLPALVALVANRRHAGKIFLACIPAIASWIAWFALLAWAATGRYQQWGRKPVADEPHADPQR
ncbi:hypothetical protein SAMN05216212_2607 [Microbulbifer yueqingensis]|uniref:Superinfection immunity protein n=2 Tax=Microbulbifer yueqingensis TaxID=658219 RepID=A0A1G9CS74_9GAMM|nr:hypothetical protein SAMN05216212_2607 [Microbulbifer yueqingensis]